MTVLGIAVRLKKEFPVIKETLERIGIRNNKTKSFFPSCYCVETKVEGVFRIVHFKELFTVSGRETTFNDVDKIRRDTIVQLLKNWNLVEIVPPSPIKAILDQKIPVLRTDEKKNFTIVHKFKFPPQKIILE